MHQRAFTNTKASQLNMHATIVNRKMDLSHLTDVSLVSESADPATHEPSDDSGPFARMAVDAGQCIGTDEVSG